MKFGKYLESKQLELPEYLGHFINYKGLKKLIKQLASVDNGTKIIDFNNQQIEKLLQDNKSTFFFRVERELEKVNEFYIEKQADLKLKLDILVNKKIQLLKYNSLKNKDYNTNKNSSITFQTLYANFKQFTKKLDQLSQFVELNETGFRKILKKWDKRSKSHLKEIYLSTTVNVQPVFHREEINQLNDLVANSILELEAYADGEHVFTFDHTALSHGPTYIEGKPVASTSVIGPKPYGSNSDSSVSNILDDDRHTDDMYAKFLNIATAPNNQLILLSNWLNTLKEFKNSERLTKVFFLAMSAAIEDIYLINFYNFFKQQINLTFVDYYTNKNFLHQIASTNVNKFQNIVQNRDKNSRANSIMKLQKLDKTPLLEPSFPVDGNSSNSGSFSRFFLIKSLLLNDFEEGCNELLTMRDNNSKIPLHYAAEFGRFDLLKLLVDKAPETLYYLDNHTMTPLLLAIKSNHLNCVNYLLAKENELSLAEIAAEQKKVCSSFPGFSPLNYACKYGDYKIIKTLLDYSNIIDRNAPNVEGLLPLHMVARSGHYKVVELLVNYGGLNPNNLCSLHNWTPIFYASYHGHSRTAKELIKYGAAPDILDDKNYTPIYYAAYNGHVNVLNTLFHSLNFSHTPLTIKNLSDAESKQKVNSNVSSPTNISNMFKSIARKSDDNKPIASSPQSQIVSVSIPSTELNLASTTEHLSDQINIDTIPSLSLPPPIIPLRKYGHNFLEKKTSLQIFFLPGKLSIKLFNYHSNNRKHNDKKTHAEDGYPLEDDFDTPLFPGRITMMSSSSDMVPRNLLLPINEKDNFVNFQIGELTTDFSMDFELYPTFGTKIIAKTTALSSVFLSNGKVGFMNDNSDIVTLPLFDTRLKNIGELTFKYQIIYSYCGTPLEITKYETYWKSTNNNEQDLNNQVTSMLSFVAASSLSGDYLKINICMLSDGTPVICPHNFIQLENGLKLSLLNLNSAELSAVAPKNYNNEEAKQQLRLLRQEYLGLQSSGVSTEVMNMQRKTFIKKVNEVLSSTYLPLSVILVILPKEISINFDIFYPSKFELHSFFKMLSANNSGFSSANDINLNSFIDLILTTVFSHIRSHSPDGKKRSIVFSSFNPIVCKTLNWKQPNFPVFFNMGGVSFNYHANNFELNSANGYSLINKNGTFYDGSNPADGTASTAIPDEDGDYYNTIKQNREELCTRSIEAAVRFATVNNLIGVILPVKLLTLVPDLSKSIRLRGLILVGSKDDPHNFNNHFMSQDMSTGNPIKDFEDFEIKDYSKTNSINGLRMNNILEFQGSIDM